MKSKLLSLAALATMLTMMSACSNDDFTQEENTNIETEKVDLVLTGTLDPTTPDPQSRVAFTPGEGNSLKAKFEEGDYIRVWFRQPNASTVVDLKIDMSTLSGDGRTVRFVGKNVTIPTSYNQIDAILAEKDMNPTMGDVGKANTTTLWDNFTNQDGTLDDALRHCLFKAVLNYSAANFVSTNEGGTKVLKIKNIKFSNSTAILKLNLKIKAGKDLNITKDSALTLTSLKDGDAQTYYNNVQIEWGQAGSASKRDANGTKFYVKPGNITYDDANSCYNIESYFAVWADKKSDETFSKKWNFTYEGKDITFGRDLTFTKDVESSTAYSVNVTLPHVPKTYTYWVNDNAQTVTKIAAAGRTAKSDDNWLSYSNSNVSVTGNSTGDIRQGIINLTFPGETEGDKIKVAQLEPKDFKNHDYNFLSYFLSRNSDMKGTSTSRYGGFTQTSNCVTKVHFQNTRSGGETTLSDWRSATETAQVTNNVGITGLFLNTILDGAIQIDYAKKVCKLGLFMDTRNADNTGQEVKVNGQTKYAFYTAEVGPLNNNTWMVRSYNTTSGKTTTTNFQAISNYSTGYIWYDGGASYRLLSMDYGTYRLMMSPHPGFAHYFADNIIDDYNGSGPTKQSFCMHIDEIKDNLSERLSNQDYIWIWLTLNDDLDAFVYQWSNNVQWIGIQRIPFLTNKHRHTWGSLVGITVGLHSKPSIDDTDAEAGKAADIFKGNNITYEFRPSSKVNNNCGGYTEIRRIK